jgi:hypothetical protein
MMYYKPIGGTMYQKPIVRVLIVIILCLAGSLLWMQEHSHAVSEEGTLTIQVYHPNESPMEGAAVSIVGETQSVTTDVYGAAEFTGLPLNQSITVAVEKHGYVTLQQDVAAADTWATFMLNEVMVENMEPTLAVVVRKKLGMAEGEPISQLDMESLTTLYADKYVEGLTGLEYAIHLEVFGAFYNGYLDDTDFGLLSSLTSMTSISIWETPKLTNISFASNMPNLEFFELRDTNVADLTPLQGLTQITTLNIQNSLVMDLSPLQSLTGLHTLHLNSNFIHDISPLTSLPSLTQINLDGNLIEDLTPLLSVGSQLEKLYLRNNLIVDITPLQTLENMAYLDLSYNQISDLSPLSESSTLDASTSSAIVYLAENPLSSDLCDLTNLTTDTNNRTNQYGCGTLADHYWNLLDRGFGGVYLLNEDFVMDYVITREDPSSDTTGFHIFSKVRQDQWGELGATEGRYVKFRVVPRDHSLNYINYELDGISALQSDPYGQANLIEMPAVEAMMDPGISSDLSLSLPDGDYYLVLELLYNTSYSVALNPLGERVVHPFTVGPVTSPITLQVRDGFNEAALEGIEVLLIDDSTGNILATAVTDFTGRASFGEQPVEPNRRINIQSEGYADYTATVTIDHTEQIALLNPDFNEGDQPVGITHVLEALSDAYTLPQAEGEQSAYIQYLLSFIQPMVIPE